jgi:hypothetical protein
MDFAFQIDTWTPDGESIVERVPSYAGLSPERQLRESADSPRIRRITTPRSSASG